MTLSSPSSLSAAPVLTDEATLSAALDCLLEHLTIPTQGDCKPQTIFQVLIRAASKQDSIEHTTQFVVKFCCLPKRECSHFKSDPHFLHQLHDSRQR
ncbi:MAG: hypothetical protein CLLPBCKN_006507 [Chroococcidiopsis cubana SAG 39.79]|nr:hypothetical protein [Chroococcidiopsis cubana SAG 39.79]